MELEDLASHFEKVKRGGGGFTSRCPAHQDRTPSLTIRKGTTGWLVKCQVGCSFFDVVTAAGLTPLDFKFGDNRPMRLESLVLEQRARDRLRKLRHAKHPPLTTLREILEVAFEPPADWLMDVATRWGTLMASTWDEYDKMRVVTLNGPVFDLLYGRGVYTGDWAVDREHVEEKMWQTYRMYQ